MSKLQRKDMVELFVGVAIVLAYFGLWATGNLPEDPTRLLQVMVGASIVAIFGDNALTWLSDAAPGE